jgi:hypothetical protein
MPGITVHAAREVKAGEDDRNHRTRRTDEREPMVWQLPAQARYGNRLNARCETLRGSGSVTTDLPPNAEALLDEFIEDVHQAWSTTSLSTNKSNCEL